MLRSHHIAIAALLVLGACLSRTWEQAPRPAEGLPDRFIPDSTYVVADTAPSVCVVHLTDPEYRIRLLLVRSIGAEAAPDGRGDYGVEPAGSYGLRKDELLRVECATGRPLGVVRR